MRLERLQGEVVADRFRLGDMVGRGGYGAVFDAEQLSVGRRCAVKLLLPGRSGDDSVEKRFRAEARTTSRLTHPHTVVLYDFGVDEETGLLFLATEFLDGFTLYEVLEKRPVLEVATAVSILEQVADSLADAHRRGLVHRDVKPKNIMLVDRAGRPNFVKVIDFGIAKALGGDFEQGTSLTQTGMLIGTPEFIAPEQLVGDCQDGRADQYALAVVGYCMLTGRNPFRAGSSMETAMRHLNDPPLPLRTYRPELEVNAEFEDAFLRALEKSAEDRYGDILDFIEALKTSMDFEKRAEPRPLIGAEDSDAGGNTMLVETEDVVQVRDADDETAKTQQVGQPKTTPVSNGANAPETSLLATSGGQTMATVEALPSDDESPGPRDGASVSSSQSSGKQQPEGRESMSEDRGPELDGVSSRRSRFPTTEIVTEQKDGGLSAPGNGFLGRVVIAAIIGCLFFVAGAAGLILASSFEPTGDGAEVDPSETAVADTEDSVPVSTGNIDESASAERPNDSTSDVEASNRDLDPGVVEESGDLDLEPVVEAGTQIVVSAFERADEHAGRRAEELRSRAASAPEPRRQPPAELTVTLIPWGTLHIDGRPHSDQTRQQLELPAGSHRLSLRQHGDEVASKVVDVEPGESKLVALEAEFDD